MSNNPSVSDGKGGVWQGYYVDAEVSALGNFMLTFIVPANKLTIPKTKENETHIAAPM